MKRINAYILTYLKWASPLAIIAAVLSAMGKSDDNLIYDLLGWNIIIWFLLLIYFVFALATQDELRNQFVRWIAGIKENDERETYIAGQASKKTFILTTGILVLLIFLSVIQIGVYKNNIAGEDGKKHGAVHLGMQAQIIETFNIENKVDPNRENRTYIIDYKGLPLSVDGVLILVCLIQIGSFYYFSRKEGQI